VKMLIAMTMMMFMQVAATEEFNVEDYGEAVPKMDPDCYAFDRAEVCEWEMTLVYEEDMYDLPTKFSSRQSCIDRAVRYFKSVTREYASLGALLGFICEEEQS